MPRSQQNTRPTSQAIGASAFGKVRSELVKHGYSQAWIDKAVGKTHGNRTKLEIAEKIMEAFGHAV